MRDCRFKTLCTDDKFYRLYKKEVRKASETSFPRAGVSQCASSRGTLNKKHFLIFIYLLLDNDECSFQKAFKHPFL